MEIKAVTAKEAKALDLFLTQIAFGIPGTLDAQYEMLSQLTSFRAKVRQAIKEAAPAPSQGNQAERVLRAIRDAMQMPSEERDDETGGVSPGEET